MKRTINKLLACVLALALTLTGFGGPVALVANAAVDDTSIIFKVVDGSNNPVSGLELYLVDPEGDVETLEVPATDSEGLTTYEMDNSSEWDIEYELKTGDESEYTIDPSVKIGVGAQGSDMYFSTVNGEAFSGDTVNVTVKKDSSENPTEPTTDDGWTVDDFTFDEAGTTVTGLTDSGKAKLMANPALEIPDTNAGKDIIGIGGVTNGYYGTFAFDGEDGVKYEPTSVKLPVHLVTIGNFAFATGANTDATGKQNGITSLELPETVSTIGMMAFRNATFTEVVIPDSVTTIGAGAFVGTDNNTVRISSVKLPSGITEIPANMFAQQLVENVVIPEGVTKIGNYAFTGNGVKKVEIPNTVTEIGSRAFENNELTELVIPSSVKKIGNYAFKCYSNQFTAQLSSITFNEGLENIGNEAFAGCKATEIQLPTTVTTLHEKAFNGCDPKVVLKTTVEEQANKLAPYTKVVAEGTGHTVVYKAPKTNVLKVKTVDENGDVVPNVQLYYGEAAYSFTTGEDGIGSYTIGQYQSGTVNVGVADSEYTSDDVIKVACSINYTEYKAYIDTVNGEVYDGEPVELVVKSAKPAFDPATLKVKVVDKDGNPVSGVELVLMPKGAKDGLSFKAATDSEGMTEYTCLSLGDEISDHPYEILPKDEDTYQADSKPVIVFAEDDDWNATFAEVDGEEYTGQIVTITVEAATHPEITSVSVDKTEVSAEGETVKVTVTGKDLPSKLYFQKFYRYYVQETNSYENGTVDWTAVEVTAEGTDTERTFDVALPAASTKSDAYAWFIRADFDSNVSYNNMTEEIAIAGIEKPELIKITAVETDKTQIAPKGGELTVTVKGTALTETAYYRLYAEGYSVLEGQIALTGDSTTEKSFTIDVPDASDYEDTAAWTIGVCPIRYGTYVKSADIEVVEPTEPTDYSEDFTVSPGEKLEGATPISYNYTDWSDYPNSKTVTANVNLYTIRVPENASEIKIDFNGNERIAYGYHNYDNKDGYDSYVNSCAADAVNGYKDNGAVGETTGTIRKSGDSFPEYIFVQTPYVNGVSEDLYVIKVETVDAEDASVVRIAGKNRYETSMKIADAMKKSADDKFDKVIVAYGENYPDALAGSFLAGRINAPILIIDNKHADDVVSYVENNLDSDGVVVLLGGTGVISSAIENRFASNYDTVRLNGANRYKTNMAILDAGLEYDSDVNLSDAGLSDYTVFICSGTGYADSLSVSSSGHPIMLVDPNKGITDEQLEYLKNNMAADFVVVGGEKAVPKSVENKLAQIGEVERIGGVNRYETSAMLADYFNSDDVNSVVLAYGENFPDGLCAGPLALFGNANLILSRNESTAPAKKYVEDNKIYKGYVIGGDGLISDDSAKDVFNCDTIEVFK